MNENELTKIKHWFKQYTEGFLADEDIRFSVGLKIDHTACVVVEMDRLTEALDLSAEDRRISRAISWLHDIGRFPQLSIYRSMNDDTTKNHSVLGLEALEKYKILDNLSEEVRYRITTAIINHNRFSIEGDLDERTLLFCKLIRDADKLDIWKVMIDVEKNGSKKELEAVFLNFPNDDNYSKELISDIENGRLARFGFTRNRNNFRLMMMSWVFDLNFQQSLKAVADRGYVEAFTKRLPDTPDIRRALKSVRKHIQMRGFSVDPI
ncbi:MAG: HD domain-containing protein [Candidatus Hatepunaea meridiana]|nr:HD domain-containing protein [Candidatus Hatepunaea meridiana]